VSRYVAPVVILAPTRVSLHANFDIDLAIRCNQYVSEHHVIISTQWSLKVMTHDNVYNTVDLSSVEKKKESYTTGKLPTSHQTGVSK